MPDKIRPYRILAATSVIVPVFLFAIVMWRDYRDVQRETQRETARVVEIFEHHARSVFETQHLVCERVNERLQGMSWDEIGQSVTVRDYLKKISMEYPQVQAIWLADPSGIVRNASDPLPPSPISVADRDYFKALRKPGTEIFIGHIVETRVIKGLNFNIAHRRESKEGTFDGIIVVTVFPEYFSNFWNKAIQRENVIAVLLRDDGMLLARAPHLDPNILKLPPTSSTMQAIRGKEEGSYFGISTHDQSKRFYAFRKVGGYNVYMVYGVGTKAVFNEWRKHVLFYGSIFGIATLALLMLALTVLKRARHAQEAKNELIRAYAEMELRVQERTAELNRANEELTDEISERRRAEEALRESETLYRSVITAMAEGMCLLMTNGEITAANPAAEVILGRPTGEILGRESGDPQWEAIYEDGSPFPGEFHPSIMTLRTGEPQTDVVMGIHKPDGTLTWISINTQPLIAGGESTPYAVVATFHDITGQKLTEESLRRLNRELRAISNCNQVLVRAEDEQTLLNDICRIICDEAGYCMAWVGYAENDEAKTVRPAAWAGVEEGYLAGAKITWADTEGGRGPSGTAIRTGKADCIQDFMTEPKAAPWREKALQRGYRSSIALPLKDKGENSFGVLNIYSSEINAFTPNEIWLLDELSVDLAFGITVLRDRIEHKRAEEAIRKAGAYNRSLIEASLDPLVTIGQDGRITDVNTATENLTGYPREQLIGTDFSDYFTEPEKARAGYRQAFQDGFVRDYPLEIRSRDGRVTSVLYNASVYRDEGGQILGVFAAARDITKRKRAEEEIRKLNAELEQRVQERTAELAAKNAQLGKMNQLFVGRELQMIKLKEKIKELEALREKDERREK